LDQVKKEIESATLVIADITGSNPNVYLKVGYAWGNHNIYGAKGTNCLPKAE